MKKFFCVLGFCIASAAANASYLYWQVTSADYAGATWDSARLVFANVNTDNYASGTDMSNVGYIDSDGNYTDNSFGVSAPKPYDAIAYVADIGDITGGSSYSYWVELYNGSTKVALSEIGHMNVSETVPSYVYANTGDLTTTLSGIANVGIWHATSYGPVPEPTSAMLMLFGAAFLGLKRKNRRIA